jgi:hypothetical protein
VACHTAAAADNTASEAPGAHANLLLMLLGRVHSFGRLLIALFPLKPNSLVPPFDNLNADFAEPKSAKLFKKGAYLRLGCRLFLTKILQHCVDPLPGSVRRQLRLESYLR